MRVNGNTKYFKDSVSVDWEVVVVDVWVVVGLIRVKRDKGRVGRLKRYSKFLVSNTGGYFNEVIVESLLERRDEGAG